MDDVLFIFLPFIVGICICIFLIYIKSLRSGWGNRLAFIIFVIVLPTLSVNNLLYYGCKKYQSEAKQSLCTIAKNQEDYFAEFGTYADSSGKLGFAVKGNTQTYTYSYSGVSKTGYTAIATSKAPGIKKCGEGNDVWIIDEKLSLKNVKDACSDDAPCPPMKPFYYFSFFVFISFMMSYVLYDLIKKKSDKKADEP